MKNKKLIMYVSIILIVAILIGVGYFIYNNIKNKNNEIISEYIPQEEITEKQLRQTVVKLYFGNNENYNLVPEIKKIDSKELIKDPYNKLINLLIKGPQNENLIKLIPEGTNLINSEIKDDILFLNFSKEFIENQNLGKEKEELILKSIVNTITELTEINKVVFLIEGEKDKGFPDNGVIFNKIFVREELF